MVNVSVDVTSDDERYDLVFLLREDNSPTMVWLELKDHDEQWDNIDYLNRLDKTIQYLLHNSSDLGDLCPECMRDIKEYDLRKDIEVIGEMFDRSIEIGLWVR